MSHINLQYNPPSGESFLIDTAPDYNVAHRLKSLYRLPWGSGDISLQRVECLSDISHFTGPDCSLEVSLVDYGIAWDTTAINSSVTRPVDLIVGSPHYYDNGYNVFYYSSYDINDFNDLFDVNGWADINNVIKSLGTTIKELYKSYPYGIYDFISYWGADNVLRSPPYHSSGYFKIDFNN